MATFSRFTTELSEIGQGLQDLQSRLSRLSRDGAGQATRTTIEALADMAERLGDHVQAATGLITGRVLNRASTMTDEAGRLGTSTLRRLNDEIEHHPLLMLAAAAFVGYLAGVATGDG